MHMYKSITYDRVVKRIAARRKYQPEIDALYDFVSSEHTNMLLEYESGGAHVTVSNS